MIIDTTNGYVKADDGAIIYYYSHGNTIGITLPGEEREINIPCHKNKSIKVLPGWWSEKYEEASKYAPLAAELYKNRLDKVHRSLNLGY